MNCREYQRQIPLFLYDELKDDERTALETHLHECSACEDVLKAEKDIHMVLAEDAARWDDIPSDLLVESRRSLSDELDRIEKKRPWWRVPAFSVVFTPMRLLESAALIAMGLALGVYVSNQPTQQVVTSVPPQLSIPSNASVSNLRIVSANPNTGQVELAGEVSQPLRLQGGFEDETVRQLLFSALRDASNAGSRLQALEVLSQKAQDEPVEEALIHALVYDASEVVRLRALEALKQFANEEHVQNAFMHALTNDESEGIRVQAIEALITGNANNSALARSIEEVTKTDENPYIRTRGLQFVGTVK
ncbi:MAG: HEAT repeat domain-containing protein [Acidobacteria bacterium]|nr:HEAT repeat domain-containing protein [Acidobacteriota bacterium]